AERLLHTWQQRDGAVDTALQNQVVDSWIAAQAYRLATFETATDIIEGKQPGPETSANKIFWSELDLSLHETAWQLLGPHGELTPNAPDAVDDGAWLDGYL